MRGKFEQFPIGFVTPEIAFLLRHGIVVGIAFKPEVFNDNPTAISSENSEIGTVIDAIPPKIPFVSKFDVVFKQEVGDDFFSR